jgi:hypothetical protein
MAGVFPLLMVIIDLPALTLPLFMRFGCDPTTQQVFGLQSVNQISGRVW